MDLYSCGSCKAAFDSDLILAENESAPNHRLPVSCQNCPYSICHVCFEGWYKRWFDSLKMNDQRGRLLECPECHAADGFDALKPHICPFACRLLQEAQSKRPAVATVTPPSSQDAVPSTSGSSSVVTPPRPSIARESSDEDESQAVAAAAASKREASDLEDDDVTVDEQKKPAAKKRKKAKKKSDTTSFVMTDEEKEILRGARNKRWIEDMATWLRDVEKDSERNCRAVMSKVKILVSSVGISYVNWSSGVRFMKGVKVDLSMNFDQMLQEAKDFEEKYGKDKGHGWLMRHPISKLGQYQQYVVVEKLRKHARWPQNVGVFEQLTRKPSPIAESEQVDDDESASDSSEAYATSKIVVGTNIYQPFELDGGEHEWYSGEIKSYSEKTGKYHVLYEDGDERDWLTHEIAPWVPAQPED